MKRHMMSLLAISLFVALAAFASDKNKDAKKEMSKDATVSGWVTDPACGKNGKVEMLNNAECTKRCAKDGKYVLVTVKKGQLRPIAVPSMLREKLLPYVEEERGTGYRRSSQR